MGRSRFRIAAGLCLGSVTCLWAPDRLESIFEPLKSHVKSTAERLCTGLERLEGIFESPANVLARRNKTLAEKIAVTVEMVDALSHNQWYERTLQKWLDSIHAVRLVVASVIAPVQWKLQIKELDTQSASEKALFRETHCWVL